MYGGKLGCEHTVMVYNGHTVIGYNGRALLHMAKIYTIAWFKHIKCDKYIFVLVCEHSYEYVYKTISNTALYTDIQI